MGSESQVKIVINADDNASKIFKGLSETLGKTVKAIQNLTGEYMEYGDQVEDMSTFTRMNSAETSRMIQTAKQAEVDYSTLSMAMKGMVNNGVQPSIETMAQLSDQFLSIRDPLAQSQFLIDQFGQRAGPEMAKYLEIGGAGIRQMAADTSQSLIVDEQKRAALEASDRALIDFNNRMTGMRYDMAASLLGIFQQMPGPIQDSALALGAFVDSGTLSSLSDMAIILGQIGGTGGALKGVGTAIGGIATATWAAVGPVLAVAGAIVAVGAAVKTLVSFVGQLFSMFQQAAANGKFWEFFSKIFNFYELGKNVNLGDSASWLKDALGLPGRASGGPVTAGQPYIVGENRPEIFVPGMSGTILPSTAGFGAGGNITLVFPSTFSTITPAEIERLAPIIRNIMRGH